MSSLLVKKENNVCNHTFVQTFSFLTEIVNSLVPYNRQLSIAFQCRHDWYLVFTQHAS